MIGRAIIPALSGMIFGSGLALGGMTDPARVRGFLDLFGEWDPTLAFVMGGAVLVMVAVWGIQARMATPLFADSFSVPKRTDITGRLIGGSTMFGIGWGIAGLCPGPAVAALVIDPVSAVIFIAAMVAGMGFAKLMD